MVRYSTIIVGLMMLFIVNPLQAQRLLEGQKSVEIAMGVPFQKAGEIDKNHSIGIALTSNSKTGNYWRLGGSYNHRTFDYKQWEIPYDLYQIEAGYFLQTLSDYRRNYLIFTGISAVGGYEIFNNNKALLQDGAKLKRPSQFVYGTKGTLSIEVYLSDDVIIGGFAKTTYLWASGLNPFQSEFGIQTRFFIN